MDKPQKSIKTKAKHENCDYITREFISELIYDMPIFNKNKHAKKFNLLNNSYIYY